MTENRVSAIDRDGYDVLVGWKHAEFIDRLILHLQTVEGAAQPAHSIDTSHVVMPPAGDHACQLPA